MLATADIFVDWILDTDDGWVTIETLSADIMKRAAMVSENLSSRESSRTFTGAILQHKFLDTDLSIFL